MLFYFKFTTMTEVILYMHDLLKDEPVERAIDYTNAFAFSNKDWNKVTKNEQRVNLERWIEERGNHQHDTLLELVDFELI